MEKTPETVFCVERRKLSDILVVGCCAIFLAVTAIDLMSVRPSHVKEEVQRLETLMDSIDRRSNMARQKQDEQLDRMTKTINKLNEMCEAVKISSFTITHRNVKEVRHVQEDNRNLSKAWKQRI